MKLIKALIKSNIYISIAAVSLTFETQVELGYKPQIHPYIFIIFFATLIEYNIHRLITIVTNKEALNTDKHKWVKENLFWFYSLISISVAGFVGVAFIANKEVIVLLSPIAFLTMLYSIPFLGKKKGLFRLREIPYLKIFLIAFVWAFATIILPLIQANHEIFSKNIFLLIIERFLFIFAITIPFDIRDIEADKLDGLLTIPLLLNERRSFILSYIVLIISFSISFFHYQSQNLMYIVCALGISSLSTLIFLFHKNIRNAQYYHYGILDGTMLLQGLLVLLFYSFKHYL